MNMTNYLTYFVWLYHSGLKAKTIGSIIQELGSNEKLLSDFFNLNFTNISIALEDEDKKKLSLIKTRLVQWSFFVEELISQWYHIIPITSSEYPSILKKNLGLSAPIILYAKWNKKLLQERIVSVVWSRNAQQISLDFTDKVCKKLVEEWIIIASWYAKWIDKQSLDSALKYGGKAIVVLPQWIKTFSSWFNKLYKYINNWNVVVISMFHPDVTRTAQTAMIRNSIIYWLTNEIYVIESWKSWGTWSGATQWLKKWYTIYVRSPETWEKNANQKLIELWAIPLDSTCNVIKPKIKQKQLVVQSLF